MMCLRYVLAALLIVLACLGNARAKLTMPELAPVDRVIEQANAYVETHPDDAAGYDALARAHYLAWAQKSDRVPVYAWERPDQKALPNLPEGAAASPGGPGWQLRHEEAERRTREVLNIEPGVPAAPEERAAFWREYAAQKKAMEAEGWQPPALSEQALDAHAAAAIKYFLKASVLEPGNGRYRLGLARLQEQYAERASHTGLAPDGQAVLDLGGPKLEMIWVKEALDGYGRAYTSSIASDRLLRSQPPGGLDTLVSYRAIKGYTRAAQRLGGEGVDPQLSQQMRQDRKRLEGLASNPNGGG